MNTKNNTPLAVKLGNVGVCLLILSLFACGFSSIHYEASNTLWITYINFGAPVFLISWVLIAVGYLYKSKYPSKK